MSGFLSWVSQNYKVRGNEQVVDSAVVEVDKELAGTGRSSGGASLSLIRPALTFYKRVFDRCPANCLRMPFVILRATL